MDDFVTVKRSTLARVIEFIDTVALGRDLGNKDRNAPTSLIKKRLAG